MIFIVNFPFCNFHSLQRYFLVKDLEFTVVDQPASFSPQDYIVLPGVGTFKEGANFLRDSGLDISIKNHVASQGSLLGICLGMQLLLSTSDESPGSKGLDVLPGNCHLIPSASDFPVPHMGWNSLSIENNHSILTEITSSSPFLSDYYFVHSFYCNLSNPEYVVASFAHPTAGNLPAIIGNGNILGMQFHPEKSGIAGYTLLDHLFLS